MRIVPLILLPIFLALFLWQPGGGWAQETAMVATAPTTTLQGATAGETASLATAILKIIGSLGLVLGLMLLVVLAIRKLGLGRTNMHGNSLIKVMDTRMIAPKKYVAVLDIADEFVVVGVTDQNINLLTKLDIEPEQLNAYGTKEKGGNKPLPSFSSFLEKAVKVIKKTDQRA